MTHRVLLDFSCAPELIEDIAPSSNEPDLVSHVRGVLVRSQWSTEHGREAHGVFNRMASQLPDSDLASFVRNSKIMMSRKGPHAELTIGYYVDSGVGKLRVRIRADTDAVIAELGRETANRILEGAPDLTLSQMDLYQSRGDQPLVQGREKASNPYRLWDRSNLPVAVPLVLSIVVLVGGLALSVASYGASWEPHIFDEQLWKWYGRVFAPMLMAVITTGSTVYRDRRAGTSRRSAEWDI